MKNASWLTVALFSAVCSILAIILLAYLPGTILKLCVLIGILVFLIILVCNPERRYFRAFTIVFGWWSGLNIIPSLNIKINGPAYLVSFLSNGPDTIVHICALVIIILLLCLDYFFYRSKLEAGNASVVKDSNIIKEANRAIYEINDDNGGKNGRFKY